MKPIVFCDLDGVLCDIKSVARQKFKETPEQKYPQSQYGFFMELPEIRDSVSTFMLLSEIFDMWFLTAPSTRNPMSYAEKNYWIRTHLGQEWCDKLIISPNKGLLRGDYLIDDNASGRGQDTFVGELIHFGSDNFKDWRAVKEYLLDKHMSKIQLTIKRD